ncbi:uncharacterized protein EAE98_008270 [Botrytis deweyae]|uniref:Uncharacterized protein n=1 Tax=Botrytis deweyae TaxID=2478750 RepID=A0ABQ7IEX2_9HELO|nr:uncharacterized protein EAE98_008270 [Botrytis deweyae]KAF7922059.1 hypothetical protein EAE98_008270 [Botrytis deweyae]
MTTTTIAELVSLLTPPPRPSAPIPYQITSGTVALFQGAAWNSVRTDLIIDDYIPNQRHVVPASQYDQTSWILHNLPLGTVMTFLAAMKTSGPIADQSDAFTCIDLVGTGKTEAVNLIPTGINDQISMFFWRTVDLNMGAIELFDAFDFTGRCSTIFLSEWPADTVHSIMRWQLQDAISSIRWRTLKDRQTAVLFDGADGTGTAYSNIKGWGTTKEVARLTDVRLNDAISSFKWQSINPMKEIIEPFRIMASNSSDEGGLTSEIIGTNSSTEPQPVTVTLNNSTAQSVTIETSDQHVAGISTSFTQTATAGVEGVASTSTQWTVAVNYSYTRTDTTSKTQTKTVDLTISQTVNAPPMSSYVATLLVTIGQLPPTEYFTTAQRWYKDPVAGSQADPQNNGWYKRVEDVRLSLTGSLACRTLVNIKATPL